jgi:activator of HSP90 ATPase
MDHEPGRSDLRLDRRQWVLRAGFAVSGLALATTRLEAASDDGISRTAEAIHQEINFNAAPARIYAVLTDAALFQHLQSFSDAMKSLDVRAHPVGISSKPGGAFSLFADYIVGRQIELVPGQRIVQAWRVASWAPGSYSLARFELVAQGTVTRLLFDHTGFPVGNAEHLAAGWHLNYWEPLRKVLG